MLWDALAVYLAIGALFFLPFYDRIKSAYDASESESAGTKTHKIGFAVGVIISSMLWPFIAIASVIIILGRKR